MLYYALMFLVVGLIAGALNLAGVSTVAVQISWILFLIGIVLVAFAPALNVVRPGGIIVLSAAGLVAG